MKQNPLLLEETAYQPASPKYTARYDHSTPTAKIDVESAISTSSPVRLRKWHQPSNIIR